MYSCTQRQLLDFMCFITIRLPVHSYLLLSFKKTTNILKGEARKMQLKRERNHYTIFQQVILKDKRKISDSCFCELSLIENTCAAWNSVQVPYKFPTQRLLYHHSRSGRMPLSKNSHSYFPDSLVFPIYIYFCSD